MEEHHYYPFGLEIEGMWTDFRTGQYLNHNTYNGKQAQTEMGWDWLNYGARYHDGMIGRWASVDPLADERSSLSTYNYVQNTPFRKIDPTGALDGDFYSRQGEYLGNDGIDDGKVYLLNDGLRANTDNKNINWGGTLSSSASEQLKSNSEEVGGLIIISRETEGDDNTISSFLSSDNSISGYFLEPGGPSTTESNQDKRIPEGVYDVYSYSSSKFPDCFILCNENVSTSRKILIHAGNSGNQTAGCLLPGCMVGKNSVSESKSQLKDIKDFLQNGSVNNKKIIILNSIKNE